MRLAYIDRLAYLNKNEPDFLDNLHRTYGRFYLLPEGGSNDLAVKGCQELPEEISVSFDVICCPCGTGGTLAGIAAGLDHGQRAIGFSTLKGGTFLNEEVAALQQRAYGFIFDNWSVQTDFHFGGFAKKKPELIDFIDDFYERHDLRLDWVYVGKMMFGIFELVERGVLQDRCVV